MKNKLADYYSRRKEAADYIEGILKKNPITEKSVLYYNITKNFGFGKSFVDKHLKLLEDMAMVSSDKVIVKWLKVSFKSPKELQDEAEADVLLKGHQLARVEE